MRQEDDHVGSAQDIVELPASDALDPLVRLVDRHRHRSPRQRILIGVVGEPGVGKSSISDRLVAALGDDAVVVPMDGFHLANRVLDRLGTRARKGAPDTFDAHGFVHLVQRLHARDEEVVYAPEFLRELDEPVAGAIAVPRSVPVVVLEGNYLLLEEPPWNDLRGLLDTTWYVDLEPEVRLGRLAARHRRHGLSAEAADSWARTQDEANARLIRRTRSRADVVVLLS